ncbi:MAG: ProQ/FinO family protein [Zoogloeaceae bacterium]|jgi:ProP effector|nr:ProQ/FinO family protein [Zoogloeaceae bacterium]
MNAEAAQLPEAPAEPPVAPDPAIVENPVETPATATESAPTQNPRALLKELQAQFPAFRDCLPLSIGIDKAIKAALPEVSKKSLRIALSLHTHGNRYLRGMAKATQRFDLNGLPVGEVTEEHRQHAAETLRERMKKQADERRAAQKAEREQQKAEHGQQKQQKAKQQQKQQQKVEQEAGEERVYAEKLALLAQKFARH